VSDFTHDFWSWYVAAVTLVSIIACAVLLWAQTTRKLAPGEKAGTMGHVWDEDLAEYNNPMPNWWRWLFYITIVFSLAYLVLYPGLGRFSGVLGWTSGGQYDKEIAVADERFGPLYAKYVAMDLKEVAADPQARDMGERLFLNYCAQCHASDARGSRGFPNLADKDWLYGGEPETIKASIQGGRQGIMPAFGSILGGQGAKDTAHYVLLLAGMTHDNLRVARGKPNFETNCAVCHGADAKGNPALGAPNLTDGVWLYGQGESAIVETINNGRHNVMPAWGEFLGEARTHILAAYVWSLSNVER
jgi:cytochrome c oxidase cbb3-type subunit 3